MSDMAKIIAGLPEYTNNQASYEGVHGYWCQTDCVLIEAADAGSAIMEFRRRMSETGNIAVMHNFGTSSIRYLAVQGRALELETQLAAEKAHREQLERERAAEKSKHVDTRKEWALACNEMAKARERTQDIQSKVDWFLYSLSDEDRGPILPKLLQRAKQSEQRCAKLVEDMVEIARVALYIEATSGPSTMIDDIVRLTEGKPGTYSRTALAPTEPSERKEGL